MITLAEFEFGSEVIRMALGVPNDVVIDIAGTLVTYHKTAGRLRKTTDTSIEDSRSNLDMDLPITNPAIRKKYHAKPLLTIKNYNEFTNIIAVDFSGIVTNISKTGKTARVVATSIWTEILERPFHNEHYQYHCNYRLYETGCQVSRSRFRQTTTITSIDGTLVSLARIGRVPSNATGGTKAAPNHYFSGGIIIDVETGEEILILTQRGTLLEIQNTFARNVAIGDTVQILPGCDHTRVAQRGFGNGDCTNKFFNATRYGGYEQYGRQNIFQGGLKETN